MSEKLSLHAMRVAFVVEPSLPLGLLANTVATLAIGLGAAAPTLGGVRLRDRTGRAVLCSADRPAPILQAPADRIRELLLKALPPPLDGIVVPFPAFARAIHQFEDYVMSLERRDLVDEAVDGLALAGPERWVRSLTGSLKLLR